MSTAATPTTAHVTGWDRTVVIALGAAGCALSYDALQQMASAVHVRGFLTYFFPIIVDGFIAYSIRALLVMRDAPLRARAYVWLLFGAATGTSLWANALHAVRLNQQSTATGLRLGDSVVAVLSTIAPLALAGAVHLYILLARGPVSPAGRPGRTHRNAEGDLGQTDTVAALTEPVTELTGVADSTLAATGHLGRSVSAVTGSPVTDRAVRSELTVAEPVTVTEAADLGGQPDNGRSVSAVTGSPVTDRAVRSELTVAEPVTVTEAADLGGQPDNGRSVSAVTGSPVTDRAVRSELTVAEPVSVTDATNPEVSPATTTPVTDRTVADRSDDRDTEELLEIANRAVQEANNRLTRQIVAQAIRGSNRTLSSDTLTQLMAQLREQQRQNQLAAANRD
ncbi:DUF2637 domain-containing protein [Kitasatospora purpeofusca]|uniref:DUF2637 domain-containing protein n=1 Tax=Kitasatospora purpeofusca TaxID=67352 RepID=UPI002E1384EF|nr:DUF2637 domain-containing protein [Kitasatospora purpeofusca]